MTLRFHLAPGREKSLLRRHPWVFSGSVARAEGEDDDALVEILAHDGRVLGRGLASPGASLVARVLVFGSEVLVDERLFDTRIAAAAALRARVIPSDTTGFRVVHAEGDGLPGLVVDRYGDLLVVQASTRGMDRLRPLWLPALTRRLAPSAILQHNDLAARRSEGLGLEDEVLLGAVPEGPVAYQEHGLWATADVEGGQKTGAFLDQRENRHRVGELARGRTVLDLYSHAGGFAVHALAHDARRVVSVDSSARALELAVQARRLNGLPSSPEDLVRSDVPTDLRRRVAARERWDVVVLDPPPFARRRADLDAAARAYKDVNLLAMRLLAPGGVLFTCTCSAAVDADLFQKIVFGASLDARVPMRLVERRGAGPDHPVSLDCPEGEYLRGLLCVREADRAPEGLL
ncbi:MAG: class I SAM-dependent rRNA methyltransferase [Deltaproteobacteria bacterium]|nr:class I SAM-dependent rRNA methyltransferase [Deltaproteobacteria bacterium]